MPEFRPQAKVAVLVGVFVITSMLYLGRDFLMPLALSTLLAFLLAPIVMRLQAWGLSRIPAVLVAVFIGFSIAGGVLYVAADQMVHLAEKLPSYTDNLRTKAASLRMSEHGPMSKLADTFKQISDELSPPAATPPVKGAPQGPMPVAVVAQESSVFQIVREYSGSVLSPLGTAAVVILIVVFMLIERQDLRDRFIHLVGRGQLYITTQALDEAGTRVSRYLLAQLIVNVTYGFPIGLGLYFIGIPNAALWGLLATVLRFIPYLGPWMAALPPMLLSFAIAPGWWPPVAAFSLFVIVELISNNAVEPWLYGSSTGLSPIAIIVSALFWTWLWGAGGLIIATPLTVCMAVIGKYVPNLSFLDVLLGDKPPIAPEHRFYQRLLAGDETELFEMVEQYVQREEITELFDDVIVPALRQAEEDFSKGAITRENREDLFRRVRDALGSIDAFSPEARLVPGSFVIVPARTEGDELVAQMLAFLLEKRNVRGSVVSHRMLTGEVATHLQAQEKSWLAISALTPISRRSGRVLMRRLNPSEKQHAMLGQWGQALPTAKVEGLSVVNTLREAARQIGESADFVKTQTPAESAPAPAVIG